MDAKKKAAAVKPLNLKDTKVYRYAGFFYAGVVVYVLAWAAFAIHYDRTHPDRFFKKNPISRYFESEAFLLKEARLLGLLPPSFENSKLKLRPIDKSIPRGTADDL